MMYRAVTKTTVNMRNLREETRPNNMVKVSFKCVSGSCSDLTLWGFFCFFFSFSSLCFLLKVCLLDFVAFYLVYVKKLAPVVTLLRTGLF